jgi:hypothetical protein
MNAIVLAVAAHVLVGGAQSSATSATPPAVVFVCEHGAAKSVIATAYFNKLARVFPNCVVSAFRRTRESPAEAGHYVPHGNGNCSLEFSQTV